MKIQRFGSRIARSIRITSTKILVVAILVCVSGMAYLGYRELSRFCAENAELRLDRASITGALLARHWFPELRGWEAGERGTPGQLVLALTSPAQLKDMIPRFEGLVREVSLSNQGAANIFAWDASSATFERIVTTLRKPDGSAPPAFRMTPEHPAYAAVSSGKAFRGDVPVAGRLRYAFLIPMLSETKDLLGIFAVDVGWSDDLVAAKNSLQTKLVTMAFMMGALLLAAALASLTLLKAPLSALRAVLNKTQGDHPEEALKDDALKWISGKGGEFEDIARGIRRLKRKEAALKRQVGVDVLTGLGNRQRFEEALDTICAPGTAIAPNLHLVLLDLDFFKQVNDELGHPAGDTVLKVVAERLRALLPDGVTLCRNGGDEFSIIGAIDDVTGVAQAIIAEIEKPIEVEDQIARISASVGILKMEGVAAQARELYQMADHALYAAKRNGRSGFHVFDAPSLSARPLQNS